MSAIIINPDKNSRKIILSLLEELNIPCGKLKDETEYLLSTEKNKNSIIKSIEQLESGETHQFVFPKI